MLPSVEKNNRPIIYVSYLNKNNTSNEEIITIAEFDGQIMSDSALFLYNNTLYLITMDTYSDENSIDKEIWYLYKINMDNYSTEAVVLSNDEIHCGYKPYGIIDNKMILLHEIIGKHVYPEDYGFKGDYEEFINDRENFDKYTEALDKSYSMEMIYYDLDSDEITKLDLPEPLLIYKDLYFYNRVNDDGTHDLVSYNFTTKEENMLFSKRVNELNAIGDKLFFIEKIDKITDVIGGINIIKVEDGNEFCYNLQTGELKDLGPKFSENAKMKLIKEHGENYISELS